MGRMWEEINGQRLAPDFPPLVLLHGVFGKPADWMESERFFADSCRVFRPRLPLEETTRPQRNLEHVIRYVIDFLDKHGIERVVLGGNSFGGHLALYVALRAPDRVSGLILTGSSGLFERGYERVPLRPDEAWVRQKMRGIFFDEAHITDQFVGEILELLADRRRVAGLVRVAASAKRNNIGNLLPAIQVPVLLVWGRNDAVTPPSVALEFKERLPFAELEFIDRCGHAPNIERPHELNLIAQRFLRRHFVPLHA